MKRSVAEASLPEPDQGGLPRTIAESIYRRLRQDILWGRFAPGIAASLGRVARAIRCRHQPAARGTDAACLGTPRYLGRAARISGWRRSPPTTSKIPWRRVIVIEGEALGPLHRTRRHCLGNLCSCRISRTVAPSNPERAGPVDRSLGDSIIASSTGVAVGLRIAMAHGACRPAVRSGGTAPDIAIKIWAAKDTEARHGARAQANFRRRAFARRQDRRPRARKDTIRRRPSRSCRCCPGCRECRQARLRRRAFLLRA